MHTIIIPNSCYVVDNILVYYPSNHPLCKIEEQLQNRRPKGRVPPTHMKSDHITDFTKPNLAIYDPYCSLPHATNPNCEVYQTNTIPQLTIPNSEEQLRESERGNTSPE